MEPIARRRVLAGIAAAPLSSLVPDLVSPAAAATGRRAAVPEVRLTWLEGRPGAAATSTWGTPWPQGAVPGDQSFRLTAADGSAVPVQSRPLAYWPDGTLKWSGHAVAAEAPADSYTLTAGAPAVPADPVVVTERQHHVDISTGVIRVRIRKSGRELISHIWRGDVEIARNGVLVNLRQERIEEDEERSAPRERFSSDIRKVTIEQTGPVRATVRIEGAHTNRHGRSWLPFTVRLSFFAGAESIRMTHTFIHDRDGTRDYIAGLGVRFRVPMRDATYDRHIRFVGEGTGILGEAVKGITGLRRDPGAAVRAAQVAGTKLPDPATWDQRVTTRLQYLPEWGDYTLSQLSSEGFTLKKRTGRGYGWVPVDQGRRACGLAYVGGVSGGLALGLRDFWQRHPTQLDVRHAGTDEAEVTLWLWAPEAGAMDTRFYHDGMGQDTYPEQLEGLAITYEDYEPGFGTPYGIARTSELTLWALPATPSAARLGSLADQVRTPPQLINPVPHLVACRVFGGLFAPVDRSHPVKAVIEDHLDFLFGFYQRQVDQRHWYGFWDHGDIMHTFDEDASGGTTWAATPGTTRSSRRTCGSGTRSCARAAPTSSASPRR